MVWLIERDGVKKYFCNGVLHISAEIAKDKRSRQTQLPPTCAAKAQRAKAQRGSVAGTLSTDLCRCSAWAKAPAGICPGDWPAYAEIRKRFKIPHDGLRLSRHAEA